MKTETWLPGFPGFYGTYYEFREDDFLYEESLEYEDIEVDYDQYQLDVVNAYASHVEDVIPWVKSIKVQRVVSPKYYNFSNDSANIEVDYDFHAMRKYVYLHRDKFATYLKNNYTSYDGFISFYSNTFEGWEESTDKFRDLDHHRLGAVMNFAFRNELDWDQFDDPEIQTYDEVMQDIYYSEYITILKKPVDQLESWDISIIAEQEVHRIEDEPFGYMGVLADIARQRAELYGVEWRQALAELYPKEVVDYLKIDKVNPETYEVEYDD
jgi:hypothetical protein